MDSFEELKSYVGFGEEDVRRLRTLHEHVMPHAPRIAARFYEHVLRFPDAAAVFKDMAQVERLKQSLVRWMGQLLTGPFDDAYYALRRRIGQVHLRVGLPSQYMFTAMNRLMEELHVIASLAFPDDALGYGDSLRRITDIELAIMLGTYIDAREQSKLEGLRDLLISHLRTTVLLVDKEGRVATTTSATPELFTSNDIVGNPLAKALQAAVVEQGHLVEHVARAVQSGREVVVPRVDVTLAQGVRALRVAVVPLLHPTADALVQIEDLTESIASEARAKQAEHLAKLGTMAASVAHEIRNPLAGISGAVQFVASSLPAGDARVEALTEVKNQIARLGTLVGDLLNFSRPITAELGTVDLAFVAHGAAAQASASEGREAVVDGTGAARADAALLAQVLLNLVQNAWQAGATRVVVDVRSAQVTVHDDGPGIAEQDRARVLEPFFTTKVRGTGLGLPVAKKIVEAMGGSLSIGASHLGGARFEVSLPPPDA